MDSTRPIRALMRGLDALCVLNAHGSATVAEVVGETRLPRTTVYRLLETFCEAGYVHRDPHDDRYRITSFVRGLGDSLDETAWLAELAMPQLEACSRATGQPVAVATPSGVTMLTHEAAPAGASGPSAIRCSVLRVPLLGSACGIAYLARCPAPLRGALIEAATRAARRSHRAECDPAEAARLVELAAAAGHALAATGRGDGERALSIALTREGRPLGALALRFDAATHPARAVTDRFLAKLQDCATRIGEELSQRRIDARHTSAPATTA
ncbi:MAG TPA: helix-turn-helix domain-containing protein [Steroidobacteraceae bacterium]|nr:helix-turn-helix domain-containing protein [Steroidobacteraceae bacterium]